MAVIVMRRTEKNLDISRRRNLWVIQLRESDLPRRLKMMGYCLMTYTSSETGTATVSTERIAEQNDMGVSTVKRHIDDLCKRGWLHKQYGQRRGNFRHCIYYFDCDYTILPVLPSKDKVSTDVLPSPSSGTSSNTDSYLEGGSPVLPSPSSGTLSLEDTTSTLPDIVPFC